MNSACRRKRGPRASRRFSGSFVGSLAACQEEDWRYVEDVIRRGIETGELRDLDPRLTTLALFGMCNWAYQWFSPDGPLRSRQLAYFFWDLFLRGASRNAGS